MQGTALDILNSLQGMPIYAKIIGTIAVLCVGGVGFNTTMGFHYAKKLGAAQKAFRQARGAFSDGRYGSDFATLSETFIEPVLDPDTNTHAKDETGKLIYLLRLNESEVNISIAEIFPADFRSEAMKFIERARQKTSEDRRVIFEHLRNPTVITEFDCQRLKTTRDAIINRMERAWTRYWGANFDNTAKTAHLNMGESHEKKYKIPVLIGEPGSRDDQLKILNLQPWQLHPGYIPSPELDTILIENTLADIFPDDPKHSHFVDPNHIQMERLDVLRSVAFSLRGNDDLLKPHLIRIPTGNIASAPIRTFGA